MATREIALGDVLSCKDQSTGEVGVLHIETDRIWVDFIGFGEKTTIDVNSPIHLLTEKGWVVSLFDNVDLSPSRPFWRKGEVGHVHHTRILSNLALAGPTAWKVEDQAKSVSFGVFPEFDFLWPKDLLAEIAETSCEIVPKNDLLSVVTSWGDLTLRIALQDDPIRNKWMPTHPWFKLQFEHGLSPSKCLECVEYFIRLFILMSWKDVQSAEVTIRRMGDDGQIFSHRILTVQHIERTDEDALRKKDLTPLFMDTLGDRETTKSVFKAWLDRMDEWQEITAFIRRASNQLMRVSEERALDACRWHETIERDLKKKENAVAPPGMKEVVEAAVAKAEECRLDGDWIGRIKSSLKGLKGETRRERFQGLIATLNDQLGLDLFDALSEEMMRDCYKTRQQAGHGTSGKMSPNQVRDLWGNVLAMETLCMARILSELPISDRGRKLLEMHPLIKHFSELRKERSV
ncbi:hypothetical protein [uncultured Roseibium sp.]|uniref:hypothetical protein n=1 Tax=uncultured Roseibium sp. TaxID=1936171 RepID=UPI003216ED60